MIALSTDVLFVIIHTSAKVRAMSDVATRTRNRLYIINVGLYKYRRGITSPQNTFGMRILIKARRFLEENNYLIDFFIVDFHRKNFLSTATLWSFLVKC
jgi:hypothetical protein